jgi:hypothetical protein
VSGRTPAQLGEPPAWLDDVELPIVEPSASLLFQCHTRKRGPLNFNPTPRGRFNAPHGEYGTTYLSTSPAGAFVETFVQDAPRSTSGQTLVTQARLDAYCLCRMDYGREAATRPLRLVDLTGSGVVLIGATGELCALADIARLGLVQRWALRLYQHRDSPDGIYYRASHDQSRFSIARFDRARGVLTADCSTNILTDATQLAQILRHYGVGLVA